MELYLFDGIIVSALYLNEKNVVALHFASHKQRGIDEMTAIVCKNRKCGLYERYIIEINNVISESEKISL